MKFCTCHDIKTLLCTISLWWVEHISNQSPANFNQISSSIEIPSVWRAPGHTILQHHVDGLVQDCSYSSANALELLQSGIKPPMYMYLKAGTVEDAVTCLLRYP